MALIIFVQHIYYEHIFCSVPWWKLKIRHYQTHSQWQLCRTKNKCHLRIWTFNLYLRVVETSIIVLPAYRNIKIERNDNIFLECHFKITEWIIWKLFIPGVLLCANNPVLQLKKDFNIATNINRIYHLFILSVSGFLKLLNYLQTSK